ncbi:hypothetical protein PHYBLDRAFT_151315 [Phycomyces blakesleeanus NRRL 1555(-)]|uniref:Uncharacterized protein n=1 Tax=Phycomyces blakesleeanus (strain ATCC 8743b / DSM 1359 / FGSC 10004 / NBRC 33097 / NRRL 1555) TaxID=763407 RepID=A0A167K7C3_PHYB8|nr:hypothetical protein PHYBLDRAFT_151315 [Phycomyces blakesleeanus NRRL 1555(-)]OAD67416.1 hypothetical protein PHYBLDRAFT_151315 [Phycomyces blakesleeanus NRRL 1555(-)]|eukprot:XP_018285456.1 hypothetical protein PHYBLDRAFT_151315 [Phycomyces blakesleeanus NRRL 1555(-)]
MPPFSELTFNSPSHITKRTPPNKKSRDVNLSSLACAMNNLSSPPIKADPSSTGRRPVLTSWKRTEWGGDRERWGVRLAMGLKNKREGKLNYPTPTTPTTPTTPPIHTTPTPIHPTRR